MENKYKFLIVDFSYILTRNLFAISKGKEVGEYSAGDLMRLNIWTINKLARDYNLTADKVVLIYDKWDKTYGGYYSTHLLKGQYKDSRKYMTEELLEEYRNDPTKTPKEIHSAELELYQNKVKYTAKWGMVADFPKIGMPCLGVDGWEADNLAYLISCLIYGKYDKPSIFVTKDSDWAYSLSPCTEYFRIPTSNSTPEIITYDKMYNQIPESLREKGVSLYMYKAYLDALGEGHNDMRKTKSSYANTEKTILEIMEGNFSNLDDPELFKLQFQSFDLSKYPRLEEAKRLVNDLMPTCGRLGDLETFHNLCDKYKLTGVSDKYFTEFISRFDEKLYCER